MRICALIFALFIGLVGSASDLDPVWKALEDGDREEAITILTQNIENGVSPGDSRITLILLNSLDDSQELFQDFQKALPHLKNPSAYLYALWSESAVSGYASVKTKEQVAFLQDLVEGTSYESTIRGSAAYTLGFHHTLTYNTTMRNRYYGSCGEIDAWSYVGTFDNTSGSGFDKSYGPLEEPGEDATFISRRNAEIHWFVPTIADPEPWITLEQVLPHATGVNYCQSFFELDSEKEVIVAAGFSGSIKIWINDLLVIEEEEERRTDMDVYKRKMTIPAGINRIVVQLGATSETNYPNFSVRLLDKASQPVPMVSQSEWGTSYNKDNPGTLGEEIPFFAETYFSDLWDADRSNPLNAMLLAYSFQRSKKHNEALKVLEDAQKDYPNNILIHYMLLTSYQQLKDRTVLLKQVEKIRKLDPDMLFLKYYDFERAMESEDLEEAGSLLTEIEDNIGENHPDCIEKRIQLLAAEQEYQLMLNLVEKAYSRDRNNPDYVMYKYLLEKAQSKPFKTSSAILKGYLKKTYNYPLYNMLIKEAMAAGEGKVAQTYLIKQQEMFPENVDILSELASFYYDQRQYAKAKDYINECLGISPYRSSLYRDRAFIELAMGADGLAETSFRKAIEYNPNSFESREKLRDLEGKEPLIEFFENEHEEELIEAALKSEETSDDQYELVFDETNFIQFEEGANVEHHNLAVRVLNESGIDTWKEAYIPTSYSRQNLIIEEAVVHKPSGERIEGERNYNQLVFPSIEVGDVVHIKYRHENYTGGKLAKEITFDHVLDDFVPIKRKVLRIFLPMDADVQLITDRLSVEPVVTEIDEFTCHEWVLEDMARMKSEAYMPALREVGQAVSITSINSWEVISKWYKDLAIPMAKEDYNLDAVYNEIFDGTENLSEYDKAKLIYDYICDNVHYSSVSFRQSNYVPQKPMVTISTQLGDCKDMSTLYHTLAKKAGLTTHLVLVNTRDNGEETMRIPSTQFNHCIVRVDMDGQSMYQELTDNNLPFGAMPNSLRNAQALVIPNADDDPVGKELISLPATELEKNSMIRKTIIEIDDEEFALHSTFTCTGETSSAYRRYFKGETDQDTEEMIKYYISDYIETDYDLESYELPGLEDKDSVFTLITDLKVEDYVKKIGALNTFELPLFEEIVALDVFPKEDREHPLTYWAYEDKDYYESVVEVTIPAGKTLVELPKNVRISNDYIDYSITVKKVNSRTVVFTRKVNTKARNISAEQYTEFRETMKDVLKAEDIFVAFK
ncbi:MAG: DUF3857 domain-containing protein [Flavobacteriales bacterium]|nr:DUF3857 domain-containing protein [Flavobacteriales bacterium]